MKYVLWNSLVRLLSAAIKMRYIEKKNVCTIRNRPARLNMQNIEVKAKITTTSTTFWKRIDGLKNHTRRTSHQKNTRDRL